MASAAIALVVSAGGYLIAYATHPSWVKPGDIAVPTIFFVGLGALIMLVTPWKELGYIPSKIFGIDFREELAVQGKERIVQIDELRNEFGTKIIGLRAEIEHLKGQNGPTPSCAVLPGGPALNSKFSHRVTTWALCIDRRLPN